jgi:hypothetical protein
LRQQLARETVQAAKFFIAIQPAEYRGFGGHPGIGTYGAKAFAGDEPLANPHGDIGAVIGWTAALGVILTNAHNGPCHLSTLRLW